MHAPRPGPLVTLCRLLSCWGCGQADGPWSGQTVPVKGKVTYKGKPLTQGTVSSSPRIPAARPHGNIQPDGTFVLTTFKEGDGAVAGSPPGRGQRVVGREGGRPDASIRTPAPRRIAVEVTEGKTDIRIDLK